MYMTHCYLRRVPRVAAILGILALAVAGTANADWIPPVNPIYWAGWAPDDASPPSVPYERLASASFQVFEDDDDADSYGRLVVVLTNNWGGDVMTPSQVLTGLFFEFAGVEGRPAPVLSPVSAMLSLGSHVWFGPENGGNLSGEWGYVRPEDAPDGYSGIGSAGYGIFGPHSLFGSTQVWVPGRGRSPGRWATVYGPNLQGPLSPAGLEYGITSAGDIMDTGNTPVTGGTRSNPVALVQSSMRFTFNITNSSAFDFSSFAYPQDFLYVSFQYGTSLTDPNFEGRWVDAALVPIPEPMTMIMLGCLGAGMLGARQVRRLRAGKE